MAPQPDTGRLPRFFAGTLPPAGATPAVVELDPSETHHARNVLRLQVGDSVELFDGAGGGATGRITAIHRDRTVIAIESRAEAQERPLLHIRLAFAVPKGDRLEWVIEKATELGVAELQPVRFARSIAGGEQLNASKRDRWRTHAIAAAKQCRLAILPRINDFINLPELIRQSASGTLPLLGTPDSAAPAIGAVLASHQPLTHVTIAVGPEGGLTTEEVTAMVAGGFQSARLGHTTLRVETAAIALTAAVLAGQ